VLGRPTLPRHANRSGNSTRTECRSPRADHGYPTSHGLRWGVIGGGPIGLLSGQCDFDRSKVCTKRNDPDVLCGLEGVASERTIVPRLLFSISLLSLAIEMHQSTIAYAFAYVALLWHVGTTNGSVWENSSCCFSQSSASSLGPPNCCVSAALVSTSPSAITPAIQ
jgi:hypothetical protein